MDESVLEVLQKVTLYELIWSFALIIAIGGILISQKGKISKWMNKWRKAKNDEDDFTKLVYDLKDSVIEIKKTIEQVQLDREHDRDDLRQMKTDVYDMVDKQSDGIKNLTDIVVKMQEKNSKTTRAEIKERIERIYRECHPAMTCTDMQFETLKELIEEYEEHGGINSFVHSTVEPEMYEWNKINKIKVKEV